jgi:serine phosphatase RsbU (regulator of sigma subunit)
MRSLKSKLILGISLFIVVLLSNTAFLQVREKERELINDIFIRARSYAELTADKLAEDYKLYLIPDSFVYFNRDLQDILAKNTDISSVKIVNFAGEVLFDSTQDKERKYDGEKRNIDDPVLFQQIQSKNISVKESGSAKVLYFKKTAENAQNEAVENFQPVDFNENPALAMAQDQKIDYLVKPVDAEYSVIYGISYEALQARIRATEFRILMLAVFGVALGILLAIVFGSTITKPLAVLKRGAEILATGDLAHRVEIKSRDEIYDLAQTFNKMAAELQTSTKAMIYKERVGKELELATQIQKQLLPTVMPKVKGLDIDAGIIPAEEIGGDCYDFLLPDQNTLLFYLGDVTGHGVPSGIVVSIANALFFNLAEREDLAEILNRVNAVMKAKTTPNMFITLVLMKWLVEQAEFSYASAGHEQIIHYIASEDRVELLPSGGLALGMVKDISKLLQVRNVNLGTGDVLAIYSDGIPEAWRNEQEMYGMERFKAKVKEYAKFEQARSIRMALLADVYEFRQGYKQMDDITCIIVKRN